MNGGEDPCSTLNGGGYSVFSIKGLLIQPINAAQHNTDNLALCKIVINANNLGYEVEGNQFGGGDPHSHFEPCSRMQPIYLNSVLSAKMLLIESKTNLGHAVECS